MTVELRVKVSPALEWGVMSDSYGCRKGPHILIPAEDIEHLTDTEIGALARTLVEQAYFACALNFADNVRQYSGESKYVDDRLIERYGDDIALLERFAGQDESIDSALETIENTKRRIIERALKVPKAKKVDQAGYIYLIHGENTLWYKIGISKQPLQRFKQLGAKSPFKLQTIATFKVPDMHSAEAAWHELFDFGRVEGEWFELSEADVRMFVSQQGKIGEES